MRTYLVTWILRSGAMCARCVWSDSRESASRVIRRGDRRIVSVALFGRVT